jgi:hypothetical protein
MFAALRHAENRRGMICQPDQQQFDLSTHLGLLFDPALNAGDRKPIGPTDPAATAESLSRPPVPS